jgi:hypothetical protein
MNAFKEDIEEAKERLKAWWDYEIIDRPCISYIYPRPDASFKGAFDMWILAKRWDDIEGYIEDFETKAPSLIFGGETIPWLWPNYGPGIMASVLGIDPQFDGNTVWFSRPTSIDEIVPILESVELNKNNEWYSRLLQVTEVAAKHAGKEYAIAFTDLGGILDIISSFLGPKDLIVAMKRKPHIIDTCRAIIVEKWLKVYKDLREIIDRYGDGFTNWLNVWAPNDWYPIQCDISYMLSPKYFERFALDDIITLTEHMEYSIYHCDGPGQLIHLDSLLSIPTLNGIQWVPGAGDEHAGSDKWIPVYEKIQGAKKNIIVDNPIFNPKYVTHLYKKLDPRGLIMILIFMDMYQTQFHLPEFLEGAGGEGDFSAFKRQYRKKMKKK